MSPWLPYVTLLQRGGIAFFVLSTILHILCKLNDVLSFVQRWMDWSSFLCIGRYGILRCIGISKEKYSTVRLERETDPSYRLQCYRFLIKTLNWRSTWEFVWGGLSPADPTPNPRFQIGDYSSLMFIHYDCHVVWLKEQVAVYNSPSLDVFKDRWPHVQISFVPSKTSPLLILANDIYVTTRRKTTLNFSS